MKVHYHTLSARNQRRNAMPYLETVQELLDDGTSLSTNLVLSWNELRTNLEPTCDLTRKDGIQVVGGTRIWED